ncbi:DVUA0089 family protein [Rubellimicrobium aerolatum]|uniref:DVUA0089 family protein n=1 Tax=Rubellimicrobium aerolatum TaxID=490979 RepID=A0ABW0SGI2_9RHOB|nr:DVUA0089 family protein [Rubellimicrobium aerolatum]MBP1806657.1 hypothetical protein [Rubellimicrobium aerolatum]
MGTTKAGRLGPAVALACGMGLPAAAQDFCGGASANGQWIGGTEAASDVATAASHLEQMALVLQNNEYVALFSVSVPTAVRLEAQGRGAGDPILDLRDEGGAVILTDDDSGGDGAARAEMELTPGRYCLMMRSYDGSPMTGFVRAGRSEHEALTPGMDAPVVAGGGGCDLSTVTAFLGEGEPLDALIARARVTATASVNETPFWGFRLSEPTAISITAENPEADPTITLYDAGGAHLADNDDWDGLNSRIDLGAPLPPGDYCLAVGALGDTALPVTVSVSAYDAQAVMAGLYDRAEAAPPLDGSHPVMALGPLATRLRQDVATTDRATWFSFEVGRPGLVLVEALTNDMGDPYVALFDEVGRQVAYNDNNGDSLDSLLAARVMPGTYLLAVRQYGDGAQAPTRVLFELFEPATAP